MQLFKFLYLKFYIFFNLYIKNTIHINKSYYSEDKEDLIVLKKIKKKKGFFVDVGCFHPTRINNTYLLYKLGWRGINIDMNDFSIKLFNIVRPEDSNFNCAVSKKKGKISYYTTKKLFISATLKKNNLYNKVIKTHSRTLNDIISSSKYKSKKIDFLSIDCEGYDLEVLKTLNFKKYSPKIICIEIPKKNQNFELKKNNTYKYIVSKKYKLIFSSNNNSMFIKK
jgi:FkbM family methyltransferase